MDKDGCEYSIILLGDFYVGKLSIILSYIEDKLTLNNVNYSIELRSKVLYINNKRIILHIFCPNGREIYRGIIVKYLKGKNGIILIYDVTNRESFEHLNEWIKLIKDKSPGDIPMILVGNKKDEKE